MAQTQRAGNAHATRPPEHPNSLQPSLPTPGRLLQALCSACAKMCVRFLRNTESPHVSVFYQAWVSLVIALCASLIPRALGHPGSIRQVDGWVEWTFMAGVGECPSHLEAPPAPPSLTLSLISFPPSLALAPALAADLLMCCE